MKKIFFILFVVIISSALKGQTEDKTFQDNTTSRFLPPITVTIGGNFVVTGSFIAVAGERVDQLVTQLFITAQSKAVGSITKPEIIKQVRKELLQFPFRGIILKRTSGSIVNIDLLKFRLTGDFKYNPYLMNDDVLIFPSYDKDRGIVDISGAVNKTTNFQFTDGDKLSDAILFAGGIDKSYDNVNEAEISRLKDNGKTEEIIKVKISDDFSLQRGDRISVLFTENNKRVFKALVLGEVNRPGYIYISKDNTTLKELITKAGGFTANADLRMSEILRSTNETQFWKMKSIREKYEEDSTFTTLPYMMKIVDEFQSEELNMVRTSNLTKEELQYSFYIDNTLRFINSKISVDFTKVFSDTSDDGKYIIHDGDIIVIPQKQNMVYVFGQVINPGFINYEPTRDWKYYISKVGGLTENAKSESDIQIIKGTGRTWFSIDSGKKVEPGDYLYVPKNLPKSFGDILQQVGAVSSIVATAVTLVYIIIQSTK